jgi:hypothetical protein
MKKALFAFLAREISFFKYPCCGGTAKGEQVSLTSCKEEKGNERRDPS